MKTHPSVLSHGVAADDAQASEWPLGVEPLDGEMAHPIATFASGNCPATVQKELHLQSLSSAIRWLGFALPAARSGLNSLGDNARIVHAGWQRGSGGR